MWHWSDETIAASGSKLSEHRWGKPEARRYHHYWRTESGKWEHIETPLVAGSRPKVFIDKDYNIFLIYGAKSEDAEWAHEIYFDSGQLIIAAATAGAKWTDWKIIHTEKGPFLNEMLGDLYRWKTDGVLSILVQGYPEKKSAPTPLRILDFKFQLK